MLDLDKTLITFGLDVRVILLKIYIALLITLEIIGTLVSLMRYKILKILK